MEKVSNIKSGIRTLMHVGLVALLLGPLSCVREVSHGGMEDDSLARIDIVASPQTAAVKSSLLGDADRITDLNVFIYDAGSLVWESYHESSQPVSVSLPAGRRYNVYVTANEGLRHAPQSEAELMASRYVSDRGSAMISHGMPMASPAGLCVDVAAGQNVLDVPLVRLAAELSISLDVSGLEHGSFELLSVRIRQSPLSASLFVPGSAALSEDDVYDGDASSAADVTALNSGGRAVFYILENCNGVLLPDNGDPWQKEYFNSLIAHRKALCTYAELTGTYRDASGAMSAEHTYRMYLGADATSDFSITRNTRYDVELSLTDLGAFRESWKVERRELFDLRTLVFSPATLDLTFPGRAQTSVVSSPSGLSYTLRWDEQAFADAGLAAPLLQNGVVTLQCQRAVQEPHTVQLRAETFDDRMSAVCNVTVRPPQTVRVKAEWEGNPPGLVAQAGLIRCSDVPDGATLSARCSEPSVARIVPVDGGFRVEALREGEAVVTVSAELNGSVSQATLDLDISPVYLQTAGLSYLAYVDGASNAVRSDSPAHEPWSLSYGIPASEFDPDLYEELLKPVAVFRRRGSSASVDYFSLSESFLAVSHWGTDLESIPGLYDASIRPRADIYSGETPAFERLVEVPAPVLYSATIAFSGENRHFMPDTEQQFALQGNEALQLRLSGFQGVRWCLTHRPYYGEGTGFLPVQLSLDADGRALVTGSYGDVGLLCGMSDFKGRSYGLYGSIRNAISGESSSFRVADAEIYLALAVSSRLERWESDYECDSDGDYFLIPCIYHEKFTEPLVYLGHDADASADFKPYYVPAGIMTDMPSYFELGRNNRIWYSESYHDPRGYQYSGYQLSDRSIGDKCLSLTKIGYYHFDLGDNLWDADGYLQLEDAVGGWLHVKHGWHLYDPYARRTIPDGGCFDIGRRNDHDIYLRFYDYAEPLDEDFFDYFRNAKNTARSTRAKETK